MANQGKASVVKGFTTVGSDRSSEEEGKQQPFRWTWGLTESLCLKNKNWKKKSPKETGQVKEIPLRLWESEHTQ